MTGKEYMSSPVISKITGELTLVVSAPIWENGVQGSKVVGVVTFNPDKNLLNNIIKDIKTSKNSHSSLIDKEGTTIADINPSLVGVENIIKQSETDKSLKPFAQSYKKLISGETGYIEVEYWGNVYFNHDYNYISYIIYNCSIYCIIKVF
jgi:methyl-accepting chemotaxis protein